MPIIPLTKFNKVVNDPRDRSVGSCRMITNFDALTSELTLSPYRDSVSGDISATTSQKQNFCIALSSGGNYRLFALGRQIALNRAEVLYKALTSGSGNDLGDNGWSNIGSYQSSTANPSFNLFVYYQNRGLIYLAEPNAIVTYDPTGSASWNNAGGVSITYTNIAQGVVHSKDDILYIPYDNNIAKNNAGSWTNVALTLPTNLVINSICEFGNYLAIACAPLSGLGKSIVYLWDRDSTLTTLSESVDWGYGNIKVLEEIEGYLVGISISGGNSTRFNNRIVIKTYTSGGKAIKLQEFTSGTTSPTLLISKQKIDNRLYLMMAITLNGAVREGVWSIGRSTSTSPLGIVHERTPNNDTALGNGILKGFFSVGDYLFISYQDNSSNFALSKTNSSSSNTATSILETIINDSMSPVDIPKQKKLMAVAATYNKLPSGSQIVVKYKVDGATSYTIVFTETTQNAVGTELQDANGTPFTDGRDYEFRVESTGGAELNSLIYSYQTLPSLINPK